MKHFILEKIKNILIHIVPDDGYSYFGNIIVPDGRVIGFDIDPDSPEYNEWKDETKIWYGKENHGYASSLLMNCFMQCNNLKSMDCKKVMQSSLINLCSAFRAKFFQVNCSIRKSAVGISQR